MSHVSPMLSQTAEYALRAILYLARVRSGEPVSADSIAEALDAPRNYLAKTLNTLAKRGFLSSTRGPFGGFRLSLEPAALTVGELIRTFDEPRPRARCLLGGRRCDGLQPCAAHSRWEAVTAEMWSPLNGTTIADLLREETLDSTIAGVEAGQPCQTALVAERLQRKD
jgi:Rrf2 family protein